METKKNTTRPAGKPARPGIINGLDTYALRGTLDKIRQDPEIARFQFRAMNNWISGAHNRASVKDFYGALQEDDTRSAMNFSEDEPPVLLGENQGPNPVEYLLIALSGCLTTALVTHAAARGIQLNGVKSRYEGDIDLRGFLGLDDDVKKQYEAIRVYFDIDADISRDEKQELIRMAQHYSPVFNSIKDSTHVEVKLEAEAGKTLH